MPADKNYNVCGLNTHGTTTNTMAAEPSDAEIQSAMEGKEVLHNMEKLVFKLFYNADV